MKTGEHRLGELIVFSLSVQREEIGMKLESEEKKRELNLEDMFPMNDKCRSRWE